MTIFQIIGEFNEDYSKTGFSSLPFQFLEFYGEKNISTCGISGI